MTENYNIPSFLGTGAMPRELAQKSEWESYVREMKRLVRDGILHPDFIKKEFDKALHGHITTFSNVVNGERLHAQVFYQFDREEGADPLRLTVYTESPILYEENELLSASFGTDLAALITRGKSLICSYTRPEKPEKSDKRKTKTSLLQVRIDEDLKKEFEEAVADADESQARVIRKLIQHYLGKGPDPKISK